MTSYNVKHIFECLLQEIVNTKTKVGVPVPFPALPSQQQLQAWEESLRKSREAVTAGRPPTSPEAKSAETPSTVATAGSPETPESLSGAGNAALPIYAQPQLPAVRRWTEVVEEVVTF